MPQPIDMQTEAARLTAAERIQQVADRISLANQQRAAHEAEARQVEHETRVQQAPDGDTARVQADARREQQERRRRAKHSSDESEKASRVFYNADEREEIVEDPGDHHLDVSI